MPVVQLGLLAAALLAGTAAAIQTPQTEPIGPYRRAFRAECVKYQPQGYCECITSGFAQELSAPELTMARLRLPAQHASTPGAQARAQAALNRAGPRLGFDSAESRSDLFNRLDALEADLQTTCGKP